MQGEQGEGEERRAWWNGRGEEGQKFSISGDGVKKQQYRRNAQEGDFA
jgi:hypothetical protein